jgi:hypothetical protein
VSNEAKGETRKMKRILGLAVAVVVLAGVASAFADGGGCCMSKKAKGDAKASCPDMFGKLNLSDKQKAQVKVLSEQCEKATSTSERHEMFSKGIQDILTPEQYSQWKTDCEKMKAGGECPFMKGEKKS